MIKATTLYAAMVLAAVLALGFQVRLAVKEIAEWDNFDVTHHCLPTGFRDVSTGEISKYKRWSPNPQQTVYTCEGGWTVVR